MPAYRKASVRELITAAYRLDGHSLQGVLKRNPENDRWEIGGTSLDAWLSRHAGEEIAVILLSMDEEQTLETHICRTCGREYTGPYCPYCREARLRLRGH